MYTDLATFLAGEVDRTSYRAVEAKTGVNRTSIEQIVKGQNRGLPALETLRRIAAGSNIPLHEIMAMAGIDLQLPDTQDAMTMRLVDAVTHQPAWAPVLRQLMTMDQGTAQAVLLYLEAQAQAHPNR